VEAPQDAIEELAMGLPRVAGVAVVVEVREQVLDAFPLAILKFIAMWHGSPPFGNHPAGQLEKPLVAAVIIIGKNQLSDSA